MYEKKQTVFKSPDLSKMQEVVINQRTKIYIAKGEDPQEAIDRYMLRVNPPKVQ